ncbi:hypothetical protein BHM03_00035363 [Ensete ventricosum]|nr:hypothetical protein BHM03_00035363 [Ensete ventricosum]
MIIALLPGQRLAAFRQEVTMLLDKTARVPLWDLTGGESAEESPDFAIELVDLVDAFYDRLDGVSVRADRDPGGYHEYIDVIAKGNACSIVDINIVIEFEIAKPTTDYMTLLRVLSVVEICWSMGAGVKLSAAPGGAVPANTKQGKVVKPPAQKKDGPQVANTSVSSEKKVVDRPPEKDRKKDVPPPQAKSSLQSDIDRFINEKIVIADKVIIRHAVTKIRDGDVLLTYGLSCVVEMLLVYAHEVGKQFRVVIVDSRPNLDGQVLLHRLVAKGINCTYTHLNAISYIMLEVTRVFLGAASVLSNGTVYSRVGTACVAMVANAFRVPVLICCDPDVISKVPGQKDLNHLDNRANIENLQLLNLT